MIGYGGAHFGDDDILCILVRVGLCGLPIDRKKGGWRGRTNNRDVKNVGWGGGGGCAEEEREGR